jgi:hypothetical protein
LIRLAPREITAGIEKVKIEVDIENKRPKILARLSDDLQQSEKHYYLKHVKNVY